MRNLAFSIILILSFFCATHTSAQSPTTFDTSFSSINLPTTTNPSFDTTGSTQRFIFRHVLAAPANDNFANATNLIINAASTAGTNFQSTLEASEYYDCQDVNGGMDATVWYKFTAGGAGTYYVNFDQTAGTFFNGAAVWCIASLPIGPCHPIQCMDNENLGVSTTFSMILTNLVNGTVYYIQVGEFKNTDNTDAFKISVNTTASYTTYNAAPLNTPTTAATGCYINSCSPSVATIEGCGAGLKLTTAEGYPSAASVGDGFSATNGVAGNGYTTQACYRWTNANVSGSTFCDAYLSYYIPGSCHGGYGTYWVDWTLYNAAGTNVITCGGGLVSNANLTITGVACTNTYVLCFMWQNFGCAYNDDGFASGDAIYAYANYPSCAPPACTPLPIQLLNFDAEYEQSANSVLLSWATASETNNKFFNIQKTTDGVTWNVTTTVPGAGNSETEKYYNATDDKISTGVFYYRLMQTDYDGNFTYSNVILMNIQGNVSSVNIFPSPTSGDLTLAYTSNSTNPILVKIMDPAGKILITYKLSNIVVGENDFEIGTRYAGNGVYIMEVDNGQNVFYRKFVKN